MQYQPGGLYTNPYQKEENSVSARKESFLGSRDTHVQEEAPKPKAKARRAAKSRAVPKRAARVAPHSKASVTS